jgi:hypothetical protein
MAKKSVLAIGIEPSLIDFSALPGLTAELVTNSIVAQIERLRVMGYDADSCLIDLGATAEAVASVALGAKHYDCVVIGAELREPQERIELFERIINLVHLAAPQTRICFNTTPDDTAEAVQRWVVP